MALVAALAVASPAHALDDFGLGRAATPDEIKAWDIDVRPDFAGLPIGSGSVADGEILWKDKCAVCHGAFGESNHVFSPLVGGVTKDDVKAGHVAALKNPDYPVRTTFMKVATISTLFDYIRRAMPWDAPRSLTNGQTYAALAYLLNLSEIVPDDFVLSDQTIRDVQTMMPNRKGMTVQHALWPGVEFSDRTLEPDVGANLCMKNCEKQVEISSTLPDHALTLHGDIADQNRRIGQTRGQTTGRSAAGIPAAPQPTGEGGSRPPRTTPRKRTLIRRKDKARGCAHAQRPGRRRTASKQNSQRRRRTPGRRIDAVPA
ncbi:MAG: hypothetical protein KDJ16_05135 [Hyphomicrobiales bacterium]|nr:hypothetical protein [Rhodoblastus sp.]MCC2111399.1 hypothetical protein [Hyphomicrobiales bacterium]